MNFKDYINTEVREKIKKELGITNSFAVPRVTKIVVNVGVGEAVKNKKVLGEVEKELALITGQKPILTKARKSVSSFKIRKGMPIGVKVTLRGKKMYHFLEKLVKIIIPRIKDFRGISLSSLDNTGNLNIGFAEQIIFPEVDYDSIDRVRGLQVTIVTTARTKEEGKVLFEKLGIPFREDKK